MNSSIILDGSVRSYKIPSSIMKDESVDVIRRGDLIFKNRSSDIKTKMSQVKKNPKPDLNLIGIATNDTNKNETDKIYVMTSGLVIYNTNDGFSTGDGVKLEMVQDTHTTTNNDSGVMLKKRPIEYNNLFSFAETDNTPLKDSLARGGELLKDITE